MNSEQLEQLCVKRDLLQSGVFVDTVKEVGLLVVVRGKDNVVDTSLKDLGSLANARNQRRTATHWVKL